MVNARYSPVSVRGISSGLLRIPAVRDSIRLAENGCRALAFDPSAFLPPPFFDRQAEIVGRDLPGRRMVCRLAGKRVAFTINYRNRSLSRPA
jgi:hypothetical protein